MCLEPVGSLNSKTTKRLSCTHAFHAQCILKWFETSDECPICRCEQDTDPYVIFKRNVEDNIRIRYQEAIRSLQRDVDLLRTRRA